MGSMALGFDACRSAIRGSHRCAVACVRCVSLFFRLGRLCRWCAELNVAPLLASHRALHRIASRRIASHPVASHRIPSHRIASHRLWTFTADASPRLACLRLAPPTGPLRDAAVWLQTAPTPSHAFEFLLASHTMMRCGTSLYGSIPVGVVLALCAGLCMAQLPPTSGAPIPLRGSRTEGSTYSPFVAEGNPRCFTPAELLRHGVQALPDGARAPFGVEKVVLERNPWPTHYVSSALAAILLEEALNIPVEPNDQNDVDTSVWQRLADGRSHINMEIWASVKHR